MLVLLDTQNQMCGCVYLCVYVCDVSIPRLTILNLARYRNENNDSLPFGQFFTLSNELKLPPLYQNHIMGHYSADSVQRPKQP